MSGKRIGLIALDLDGTLLNEQKKVTAQSIRTLALARERGVDIAICTGRNDTDAQYYGELLGFPVWGVTANGAYVRKTDAATPIYTALLNDELAKGILEICRVLGTTPCLHTPAGEYTGKEFARLQTLLEAKGITLFFNPKNRYVSVPEDGWEGVLDRERGNLTKAILYHEDLAVVERMEQMLMAHGGYEVAPSLMFHGTLRNLEVNRAGVSKGSALAALTKRLGISMEQVMALGDSENDLTMLRDAGLGIAMGNASEAVKAVAAAVTGSNEEDGVAQAICRYVLNR